MSLVGVGVPERKLSLRRGLPMLTGSDGGGDDMVGVCGHKPKRCSAAVACERISELRTIAFLLGPKMAILCRRNGSKRNMAPTVY